MPRASKSRSRKSPATARARVSSAVDRVLMRRYLAFVRAIVGASAKTATR